MCTQCHDHVVLDINIICIREVVDMEELLNFLDTLCSQYNLLVLLIN